MRIRKHGNTYAGSDKAPKYEKFKCEKCGCEFNCEEDEYYVDLGGAEPCEYGNINLTKYTIKSTITDYLVCSCPECHKIVTKTRERKKEYYHYDSYLKNSTEDTNTLIIEAGEALTL